MPKYFEDFHLGEKFYIPPPMNTGLRKREDCSTNATIEPSSNGDKVEAPTAILALP